MGENLLQSPSPESRYFGEVGKRVDGQVLRAIVLYPKKLRALGFKILELLAYLVADIRRIGGDSEPLLELRNIEVYICTIFEEQ